MPTKDRIRTGRKALGLTEQQFADAVGVSRGAVQQWEKGETAPKRRNQAAVARKLGISVSELMEGSATEHDGEQISFSVAEPAPLPYDPLLLEAATLLETLNHERRREAVKYLRYLAASQENNVSPADESGKRDSVPPPAKAA
ncbi:MAG: helix-turn-helix transcriptional regulator [Caldisericota bacterium]|nr:helix-turn-helix transcriptional regulator [Caldisericota bacterium]